MPRSFATLEDDTFGVGRRVAFTHTAKWARPKIMPIYSEILKAYSFEKTGEGFYDADTLTEITDKVLITNSRPNELTCEIDLGKENKNKKDSDK